MKYLSTFLFGVLFAVGLGVAGMTQPQKVIGFLDILGQWDPSLAVTMLGAVVVYFLLYRLIIQTDKPVLGAKFALPTRRDIDHPLIMGATLFGAGWGLAGFCPGPALVASVTGDSFVLIFVLAMVVGMYAFEVLDVRFATDPDGGAGPLDQISK